MQGPAELQRGAGSPSSTPQLARLARCTARSHTHTHTAVKPRFGIPNIWQGCPLPLRYPHPAGRAGQGVLRKSEPGRYLFLVPGCSCPYQRPQPHLPICYLLWPTGSPNLLLGGETRKGFTGWVRRAGASFRPRQKVNPGRWRGAVGGRPILAFGNLWQQTGGGQKGLNAFLAHKLGLSLSPCQDLTLTWQTPLESCWEWKKPSGSEPPPPPPQASQEAPSDQHSGSAPHETPVAPLSD